VLVLVLAQERVPEMALGPARVRGQVTALAPEMARGLVQAPETVLVPAQAPVKACPTPEAAPVRRCFLHLSLRRH